MTQRYICGRAASANGNGTPAPPAQAAPRPPARPAPAAPPPPRSSLGPRAEPAVPAAGSAVSTPQSSAPPSPVRTGAGAASIPTNIPNLGGRRPKQAQSVRQPGLCFVHLSAPGARLVDQEVALCLECRVCVLQPSGCKHACVTRTEPPLLAVILTVMCWPRRNP